MTEHELAEYRGETAERLPRAALGLNLLLPGLGYLYCGRPRLAATIATVTLAVAAGLVSGAWTFEVFLLKPIGVLALLVLYAQVGMGADLVRLCRRLGPGYVLRGYNHPLVYLAAIAGLVVAPLLVSTGLIAPRAMGSVEVSDLAMYPRLAPGDHVYFARDAFELRSPVRGELVVAVLDQGEPPRILRVVGTPGETVAVHGPHVLIDGQPLSRIELVGVRLDDGLAAAGDGRPLQASTEHVAASGLHYAIFHATTGRRIDTVGPFALGDDEYFLLGDFRDAHDVTDSRTVGPVPRSALVGRPLYIWWSSGAGAVRWARIGLSLRSGRPPAP